MVMVDIRNNPFLLTAVCRNKKMKVISKFEEFKIKILGAPEIRGIQCWFFHRWSRWEQYKVKVKVGDGVWFDGLRQYKKCLRCGYVKDIWLRGIDFR